MALAADADAPFKPVPGFGAGGAMATSPAAAQSELPIPDNSLGILAAPEAPSEPPCEFGGTSFCGPPGRFWFRASYVHYWTSGMRIPALVTTGPVNTGLTASTDPFGTLDRLDTTVLYGDDTIFQGGRSGFHINMGFWLDACQNWGIQADWLDLGPQKSNYSIESDSAGAPALARPYYDVQDAREWRQLVSYPGTLRGGVSVDAQDYFNTAGVSLRKRLCMSEDCGGPCGGCGVGACQDCGDCFSLGNCCRLDLIVGYRYYGLTDSVHIREDLTALAPPLIAGNRFQVSDQFRAVNQFHGVELGLSTDLIRGRWTLNMMLKASIGNNHQIVNIDGQTIITNTSGQSLVYDAGVYAVRTNTGTYTRNDFVVIPEISLEAGYMLNCHWRATIGYNLIYWGSVQRSGNAIDLNIDPRNIPGGLEDSATHFPQFRFCGSNFWAQGIRAGLEYRF
jgi:hypothetical protein